MLGKQCWFHLLQGDADIFFPTDFWLLQRIDHYCSGWRKEHDNKTTRKGKKEKNNHGMGYLLL